MALYLLMIAMVTVVMVTSQEEPSTCTTEYYRDLPLSMQSEHQCLLLEHFNSEFNRDREDRIRRYKELNVGLQDINYKLDTILADLDPDHRSNKVKDTGNNDPNKAEKTAHSECKDSVFQPSLDLKPYHKDCYDLQHVSNVTVSGVYPLRLLDGRVILAQCDMQRGGGGWTTIHRRLDGSVNFNRNWTEYQHGFGNPNTEYWLGLENIHQISANQNTSLRVDLWDWDGKRVRAEYLIFYVLDATTNYTLHVHSYRGNAGDSLSYHNNQSFSTPERDHDAWPGNCAEQDGAGWWYRGCSYAALNSRYRSRAEVESGNAHDGILWYHWKETYSYPLPKVEMKVRPAFL